jgi:transposase
METKKKKNQSTENFIKEVRRRTRRVFSSEQKIQIVMEGMRAEMSVAELCRKYSIAEAQFTVGIKSLWKLVKRDYLEIRFEKLQVKR